MTMHPIQQQILLRTKAVPLLRKENEALPGKEVEPAPSAECGTTLHTSYDIPPNNIPVQSIPETGSELALAFLQSLR